MEKINFVNNSQPAINDTNLNKLQQNVEDDIGLLEDLETSARNNLVAAINEAKLTGGDAVPIYSIFDYDGETAPTGYEQVNSYSTTEVKTGDTWIDGKPIYRKVIETTQSIPGGSGFTSITINHNIQNVDKIWMNQSVSRIENIALNNYMSYALPLVGYEGNTTDTIYVRVNKSSAVIYGSGWGTDWNKVICLDYTKTTD